MIDRTSRAGQLTLGGFEPVPPSDRLFFAIFPDAATAARIAETARTLRDQQQLRGRPLRSERFHVTLHFLGDYAGLPADVVAQAGAAAAGWDAPMFEVAFDHAASFAGHRRDRPFVLRGGDGLDALLGFQRRLGERLAAAGLGRLLDARFTPHVTLLYDEQVVPAQAVAPIAWPVREFVLVHSLLGRGEHRILGRWPLQGHSG